MLEGRPGPFDELHREGPAGLLDDDRPNQGTRLVYEAGIGSRGGRGGGDLEPQHVTVERERLVEVADVEVQDADTDGAGTRGLRGWPGRRRLGVSRDRMERERCGNHQRKAGGSEQRPVHLSVHRENLRYWLCVERKPHMRGARMLLRLWAWLKLSPSHRRMTRAREPT